jgi:hypothetical protein
MAWQFLGSNSLIWQPDTRVTTFPSGLILAQRSAICRRSALPSLRGSITLGGVLTINSPAIDGLNVFPGPQEEDMGDGFARIVVSAYGRWTDQPQDRITFGTANVPKFRQVMVKMLDGSGNFVDVPINVPAGSALVSYPALVRKLVTKTGPPTLPPSNTITIFEVGYNTSYNVEVNNYGTFNEYIISEFLET